MVESLIDKIVLVKSIRIIKSINLLSFCAVLGLVVILTFLNCDIFETLFMVISCTNKSQSHSLQTGKLDLDSYGGTDPLGVFPLFLKRTAEVLAPCLAVVFRRLLRLDSFPVCWRVANISTIPIKGSIFLLSIQL